MFWGITWISLDQKKEMVISDVFKCHSHWHLDSLKQNAAEHLACWEMADWGATYNFQMLYSSQGMLLQKEVLYLCYPTALSSRMDVLNSRNKKKKVTVRGCIKFKWKGALGILADATVGPKSSKSLKQKLPDFLILEQDELSKNFGAILDRFHLSQILWWSRSQISSSVSSWVLSSIIKWTS